MGTSNVTETPRSKSNLKSEYQDNMFKTICEMGRDISRYEHINAKFVQLTDYTMEQLLEMFAAGYTLTPPKKPQDLANISASIME